MSVQTGYVETHSGPVPITVDAATFAGWDRVAGAWSLIQMQETYIPAPRGDLPHRAPCRAGDKIALPSIEAAALVTAGYATSLGGSATQSGVGVA